MTLDRLPYAQEIQAWLAAAPDLASADPLSGLFLIPLIMSVFSRSLLALTAVVAVSLLAFQVERESFLWWWLLGSGGLCACAGFAHTRVKRRVQSVELRNQELLARLEALQEREFLKRLREPTSEPSRPQLVVANSQVPPSAATSDVTPNSRPG